jgi:RimJ/RimL family protein N-acetyltransferase
MDSPDTRFYLLLENGEPVGQIRYDRDETGEAAEISFSLAKEHRGKRLGIKLLELTRQIALKDLNCERITALVIKGNEASNRAFLRAGFEEDGLTERLGKTAYKFVWKPTEN